MIEDWRAFLTVDQVEELLTLLRRHIRIGRPLGSGAFLQ
jgi:hypothetical protein